MSLKQKKKIKFWAYFGCDNIDILDEKENKKSILQYKKKTSILSKTIFIIGVILISISAFLLLISSAENEYIVLSEIFLSLSIILFAFSAIIYFLKRQFDKLENIANNIENNDYEKDFRGNDN